MSAPVAGLPPVTARVPVVSPQLTRPAHAAKSTAKVAIRIAFLPMNEDVMWGNKRPNSWPEAGKFAAWHQTIVNKPLWGRHVDAKPNDPAYPSRPELLGAALEGSSDVHPVARLHVSRHGHRS